MTPTSGTASAVVQGNQLQVTASADAVLRWQSFDIAPGERTVFLQPSAASVVWNHIDDPNPSSISGRLEANGMVVVVNPAGFHFGSDAVVRAAGLVVSTAAPDLSPAAGALWQFHGPPSGSAIVNYGRLEAGPGGSVFLISDRVENHGEIHAPGGAVGLLAGQDVQLSERPDGRGLSASVRLPVGAVDNTGKIVADAGEIAMHARVVNQGGYVQADALVERGGVIELVASESLTLGAGSTVRSHGDDSSIVLQSSQDVGVSAGASWDLASGSGDPGRGGQLAVRAGADVRLGDGLRLEAGDGWRVEVRAGAVTEASAPGQVESGIGNVRLEGTATLQTASGPLDVKAGNDVRLGSGALRSVGGGGVSVTAVAGSIHAGTSMHGFLFRPGGDSVDPDLGGISTADGGDVRLTAGLDVTSQLPFRGDVQSDAGSGAFGAGAGDVTIAAGRDVSGHFVVANGRGSIEAGRDAGTAVRPLALSLVAGGWEVAAGRDLRLQEVRNPNGVFNNLGFASSPSRHRFDYTPEAYANLSAGHGVELLGTALPRYLNSFSQGLPPIYPGTLRVSAGAGGVTLGNDVVLFPSATGQLTLTTTEGGGLSGTKPGDLTLLVLSDSGRVQYRAAGDFGITDHATTPLHVGDTEPVRLDISGGMSGILLGSAKRAEVRIGGDMVNSRFDVQNLRSTDVTSLRVAGDIWNRDAFTSVGVSTAPRFDLLDLAYPELTGTAASLPNLFRYDVASGQITFQGRMTGEQLQALLGLRVRAFDAHGLPLFDAGGEPLTVPAEVADRASLERLFSATQDVPLNPDSGYLLGGGGRFEVAARQLNLGATLGIVTQGPRGNPALAKLFARGADLQVDARGDLNLVSAKIASLNGGAVTVTAGGDLNVGTPGWVAPDATARGIFTVNPSDVTVVARGDIRVNGSRIAAYDGGNVTVRSLEGDIDAGTGGLGAASVEKWVVDPDTRRIRSFAPTIPGSGILATTFPPSVDPAFPLSLTTVGSILVEAPRGDIRANAGGIVQIPLNGQGRGSGTVTLRAGSRGGTGGEAVVPGDIDVSGSGVVGGTVRLEASGDVRGTVVARENLEVAARLSAQITALVEGRATIQAGETVSGTIIGVEGVTAEGSRVDAALLSSSVSIVGESGSAEVGFAPGAAAASATQGLPANDSHAAPSAFASQEENDDPRKTSAKSLPRLGRGAGRVTVLLPPP